MTSNALPVYPVTGATVAYAAAGAVARDLSFLFPAMLARKDLPEEQLFIALTQFRDQAKKERNEATSATRLTRRYLEVRGEVLDQVVSDMLRARRESRLEGFLSSHRAYLVGLLAARAPALPAEAPRMPSGDEGWLLDLHAAPGLADVERLFQLYTNDEGHYLGRPQAAAAA